MNHPNHKAIIQAEPVEIATVVATPINTTQQKSSSEASKSASFDFAVARSELQAQGFPKGLVEGLIENVTYNFSLRIWVLDNSGSMQASDGSRLVETSSDVDKKSFKSVKCTRFQELKENAMYHAKLAGLLKAPTIFRMLNNPGPQAGPQQFTVADNPDTALASVDDAVKIFQKCQPEGLTPLLFHIKEIIHYIKSIEGQLLKDDKKVVVVLATDGIPTDATMEDMVAQLKELEKLPVWLIFRLCTDDKYIIDYYNDIDQQLERNVENLDDFTSEAKEVYKVNPWINYTLTLHRAREMGFKNKLFDLIDERPLTLDEVGEYVQLLLGEDPVMPSPAVDFDQFVNWLTDRFSISNHDNIRQQWNPVLKKAGDWVEISVLKRRYAGGRVNTFNTRGELGGVAGCCVIS